MKRGVSLAAVVVALLSAAAVYLVTVGAPLVRVAELIGEGNERQLRDLMRPAQRGPRVLVFALDGVGEDELLHAVRGGAAGRMAAALSANGPMSSAYAVPGVLSVLPSTTLAAWSSLFTGEPPARTGVPGNEWFAREELRFYAPAPVSIEDSEHALAVYTNGLLDSVIRVPTLYELADVRAYVSLSQVHRGADLLILPDLSILGELVGAVAAGLSNDDGDNVRQEAYGRLDTSSVDQLVESLRRHGVPDLQVVYFPGIDLYTHVAERPIESQRRYIAEVIDVAVGTVLDTYRLAGVLEHTYVLFVADHGHTPVLNDDRHALSTEGDDEPPAVLRQIGYRVRPFELELDEAEQAFQATLAYQGAMAYVYLADRSTCERADQVCDWNRPPRFEEDVLPVVRAFDEANRAGAHVPALLGTLDLIFARQPRAPGEDALPFQVWDGTALVPVSDYLRLHPRPDLLDLDSRLQNLAAGPYGHRAGDVLLLARSSAELPIEDRYYFSSAYRSWHGSPAGQDSRIPLIVARRGMSTDSLAARVHSAVGARPSQLDITRLILALLREPL